MDERELLERAAAGVRLLEDGDSFAESDGRRMARNSDSLVLSVPGWPPYTLALPTELDRDPEVRIAWGEGPNVFVRVARHKIDATPPQQVFHAMHIDASAHRVLQSADANRISDEVATLLRTALQLPDIQRHEVASQLRISLDADPARRARLAQTVMESSCMLDAAVQLLDTAMQLAHHERCDLAEWLFESCSRSIRDWAAWMLPYIDNMSIEELRPDAFAAVAKPSVDVRWSRTWGPVAWKVTGVDGGIAITTRHDVDGNTGPALPFARSKDRDQGRQHVLELPDGFLVGVDHGEWGGKLDFFTRDGSRVATLVSGNTNGIVRIADNIISLHGLDHLSLQQGSVRFWTTGSPVPELAGEHLLDGAPGCFVVSGSVLWVLTSNRLWRSDKRKVKRAHAVNIVPFSPTSLAVDRAGDVWAGMRHFVLHFKRRGDAFEEEWLVAKER